LRWIPKTTGIYPFYCTDFCSALHQEMQGYVRVSAPGSNVALTANISAKARSQAMRAQALPDQDHKGMEMANGSR
jgi:nitrous-oxide reductase